MQIKFNQIVLLAILIFAEMTSGCSQSDSNDPNYNNSPTITGNYLGQVPPGAQPQLFAPEIFTEGNELHSNVVFSPDGQEVFWTLMESYPSEILYMKLENGVWTNPALAPFSSPFGSSDPSFSPDGNKVFFMSRASASGNSGADKENIWYVERDGNDWGDPQMLSAEINYLTVHWQVSVASNGNLYFSGCEPGSEDRKIWFSEFVNGNYTQAQLLGNSINSYYYEGTPFIAPDESYLIFSSRGDDLRYTDLFISYKQENGSWSQAINMGSTINSYGHDLYPIVSGNGEYLFFLSSRTGILRAYWVDAEIISKLKEDSTDY